MPPIPVPNDSQLIKTNQEIGSKQLIRNNNLGPPLPLKPSFTTIFNGHLDQRSSSALPVLGKQSRDGQLKLTLCTRNLKMSLSDHEQQTLQGTVTLISPETILGKSKIMLGILGRMVVDHQVGIGEYIVYQSSLIVNDEESNINATRTITQEDGLAYTLLRVNNEVHFKIRLSSSLPATCLFATKSCAPGWGLNWYICALVLNENIIFNIHDVIPNSSTSVIVYNQPNNNQTSNRHLWDSLRIAGLGKCVIAFTLRQDIEVLMQKLLSSTSQSLPGQMVSSRKKGKWKYLPLLSDTIKLQATLDKSVYKYGEPMRITVQVNMPRDISTIPRINRLRLVFKQRLHVQFLQSKEKYKSAWMKAEWKTAGGIKVRQLSREPGCTFSEMMVCTPRLPSPEQMPHMMGLFNRLSAVRFGPARLPGDGQLNLQPAPTYNHNDNNQSMTASAGMDYGLGRLKIFSIEYYVNVHAVMPFWHPDLIVKLPFSLVMDENLAMCPELDVSDNNQTTIPRSLVQTRRDGENHKATKEAPLLIDLDDDNNDDQDDRQVVQETVAKAQKEKNIALPHLLPLQFVLERLKEMHLKKVSQIDPFNEQILLELIRQCSLIIDRVTIPCQELLDALQAITELFPPIINTQAQSTTVLFAHLIDTVHLTLVKADNQDPSLYSVYVDAVKGLLRDLIYPLMEVTILNLELLKQDVRIQQKQDENKSNDKDSANEKLLQLFRSIKERLEDDSEEDSCRSLWQLLSEYVDCLASECPWVPAQSVAMFWQHEFIKQVTLVACYRTNFQSENSTLTISFIKHLLDKTYWSKHEVLDKIPSWYSTLPESTERKRYFVLKQVIDSMSRL